MNGLLERACEAGEILELIYISDKKEITYRKIKVLKISTESVRAYCFTRNQQRSFKFTNILSIGPVRAKRRGA